MKRKVRCEAAEKESRSSQGQESNFQNVLPLKKGKATRGWVKSQKRQRRREVAGKGTGNKNRILLHRREETINKVKTSGHSDGTRGREEQSRGGPSILFSSENQEKGVVDLT